MTFPVPTLLTLRTLRTLLTLLTRIRRLGQIPALSVAFSPSGSQIAAGHSFNNSNALHVWTISGEPVFSSSLHLVSSMAYSPEGGWLATPTYYYDVDHSRSAIDLWRTAEGVVNNSGA